MQALPTLKSVGVPCNCAKCTKKCHSCRIYQAHWTRPRLIHSGLWRLNGVSTVFKPCILSALISSGRLRLLRRLGCRHATLTNSCSFPRRSKLKPIVFSRKRFIKLCRTQGMTNISLRQGQHRLAASAHQSISTCHALQVWLGLKWPCQIADSLIKTSWRRLRRAPRATLGPRSWISRHGLLTKEMQSNLSNTNTALRISSGLSHALWLNKCSIVRLYWRKN